MALRTMLSPQPYHNHSRSKKRRRRSISPRRSRSGKSNRHSSVPVRSNRYSYENKVRPSSRHVSPQQSHHRHLKHRKTSPGRKKVLLYFDSRNVMKWYTENYLLYFHKINWYILCKSYLQYGKTFLISSCAKCMSNGFCKEITKHIIMLLTLNLFNTMVKSRFGQLELNFAFELL